MTQEQRPETLGDRLKTVMVATFGKRGATSLAKAVGCDTMTIIRTANNETMFRADIAAAVCRVTGASPAWLLLGDGPMMAAEMTEPATCAQAAEDEAGYCRESPRQRMLRLVKELERAILEANEEGR